jgi:hypothetical protein
VRAEQVSPGTLVTESVEAMTTVLAMVGTTPQCINSIGNLQDLLNLLLND